MQSFSRSDNLPPYVFSILDEFRLKKEQQGMEIIDLGMGNPDQPPAAHIIETLIEATRRTDTHRYSASRGITDLREAICRWYQTRFQVSLDPDKEAIATIGSKDGLAHLSLAVMGPGDVAIVPSPCYPIHMYSFIIAGAAICFDAYQPPSILQVPGAKDIVVETYSLGLLQAEFRRAITRKK